MMNMRLIRLVFIAMIGITPLIGYAMPVDPTRPFDISSSRHDSRLALSAIMIGSGKRIAVINGRIVHIGDQVGFAKVVSIEPNQVQLISSQGMETLTLLVNPLRKVYP